MEITYPLNRFERCLTLLTKVEAGDGRRVAVLAAQALVLMVAYYLVRPVREALILTEGDAEFRSYAVGVQALVLVILIPLYGCVVRAIGSRRVLRFLCLFFAAHLVVFCALGHAGYRLGFVFFIWVSMLGVILVSQFWAFATDLLSVASGQRLFGVIAVGISGGAWLGSSLATACFPVLGPYGLMLASATVLVAAALLTARAQGAVSGTSPCPHQHPLQRADRWLGGFALIARTPYLAGIAALVVLLNWITSTGEFVLSSWLIEMAPEQAAGAQAVFIGQFMGRYCASITLLAFMIQLLLVSRVIQFAGLARALACTPFVFVAGYLLIGIVPVFALLQSVLIVQKSLDYSLFYTTRSALLLPTSRDMKYQAKTAIDTVFYRLGDLLSTVSIYLGLHLFEGTRTQLLWLTLVLSATMTWVAWLVGREYSRRVDATYHGPSVPNVVSHDNPRRKTDAATQPALPGFVARGA